MLTLWDSFGVSELLKTTASGEGAVLTISSAAALEHFGPGLQASALKAAATVYASGLAQTLAVKGIRVNTIVQPHLL